MFLRVLINSGRDLQLIVYHYIPSELHSLHILLMLGIQLLVVFY